MNAPIFGTNEITSHICNDPATTVHTGIPNIQNSFIQATRLQITEVAHGSFLAACSSNNPVASAGDCIW